MVAVTRQWRTNAISPSDLAEAVYPDEVNEISEARGVGRVVVRQVTTYTVEFSIDPLDCGVCPGEPFTFGSLFDTLVQQLRDDEFSVWDLEDWAVRPMDISFDSVEVLDHKLVSPVDPDRVARAGGQLVTTWPDGSVEYEDFFQSWEVNARDTRI